MKYYKAVWMNPTELYSCWNNAPHLLIYGQTYIISVATDGRWPYIVTVYTEEGKQITKISYDTNPNKYWEIIESLA